MKTLLRGAFLVGLLVSCVPPCFAVKLRFNWREGDTFRYRTRFAAAMEAALPIPGATGQPRFQQTGAVVHQERVLRVQSDGTLDIESSTVSGSITSVADGNEITRPAPKNRSTQRMTPLGKVTSASQEEDEESSPEQTMAQGPGPSPNDLFDASLLLVFPNRDLQVGERWTEEFEVEVGGAEKPMKVEFSGELLDLVTIDLPTAQGLRCAKIKAKFHIPMSDTLTPDGAEEMGSATINAHVRGEFITYFAYEKGVVAFSDGYVTAYVKTSISLPPGVSAPPGLDRDFEATAKMKMNVKTVWQR